MAPPVIVQSNVGSGSLSGSVNVALRRPPTAGNLLVLLARKRGSAKASSVAAWSATTEYSTYSVVTDAGSIPPFGTPVIIYRGIVDPQYNQCTHHEVNNKGFEPVSYLFPTICFASAWWEPHPNIDHSPTNNGWTVMLPGNGIGIWTKTSDGSDGFAIVDMGGLPYDVDVYMLEVSNGSVFDIVSGSGTGSPVSASGDGISVTVPLPGSFTWDTYLVVLQSLSTSEKIGVLLITPESIIAWEPVAGNPPAGWSALPGRNSELLAPSLTPATPTSDIVTDICLRAGLDSSQIDVSLLTNANIFGGSTTVLGYLVERPTAASEILKPLMQAYFFDGCETNGTMRWVPRGMASAMSIPETDLGLLSDGAKVKPEQIAQEQDLPLAFRVLFNDIALDYQQGHQERTRSSRVKKTKQQTIISLPIVMTSTQALQIAETALYLAWLERNSYTFNLGSPKYMQLDPTDVIQFTYEGLTFQIRVVENSLGQGFAVMISGVNEDARNFLSSLGAPAPIFNPAPIRLVGPTQLFLFDVALLQDTDANPGGTGFYFAVASGVTGWTGAALYQSSDDANFAPGPSSALNATFGYATTTLAAPRTPWDLDTVNTVTVQPVTGALGGDSLLNMLNGSNAIILGSEIIQFVNCVDNGDGTFTLSNLLRGRRGTEWACGSHGSNELFVMPASGAQHVPDPLSVLGQALYYKGVTIGQDPSLANTQQFTIAGADLAPYAPCHIGGYLDGSNDIVITWLRRTRIGGEADWADGVADVPLSEDAELYDVDVMNGSTVVRTFSNLTTPICVYTVAQQTADWGSPP